MIQTVRVKSDADKDRIRVYRLEGINKNQAKLLAEKLLGFD